MTCMVYRNTQKYQAAYVVTGCHLINDRLIGPCTPLFHIIILNDNIYLYIVCYNIIFRNLLNFL